MTPYNLWSVRALRYFMVLFLIISFLWWIVLLVSTFVSPPKMNSRGSGFFDFSYTTLTVGNLLVALLFFTIPSKAMEISSLVVAGLLLIDMIIVLAVQRLRAEEGWVGVASVIWATVIALYNVLTDRVVAWGKKEEEERLTGRQESRRSLKEWLAVLASFIIMVVQIVVVILLTATLVLRARDASLAPPGKRYYVDGGKYELHLACVGEVTHGADGKQIPTVICEAGERPFEDTFDDWIYNAHQNGTIDRYCYYDRPGIAWSDNAPSPHSAGMTADSLTEALIDADIEPPWVLVSAGVGSIYSRIFASRHPHPQVQGIFLIDGLHEDLLGRIGNSGRGFMLWLRGVISPLGWDRLPGALFNGRTREDRIYGKSAYQSGKQIKAKLQENLVATSLTKNEVVQSRSILEPDTPLVVVSSGISTRKDREWNDKQQDLTKITNNLVAWDVVGGAPHEVWRTLQGREVLEKRLGELVRGKNWSNDVHGVSE